MRCSDGESESLGVRDRHFDLDCEGRRVPGVLRTHTSYLRAMARRFVRHRFLGFEHSAEQLAAAVAGLDSE